MTPKLPDAPPIPCWPPVQNEAEISRPEVHRVPRSNVLPRHSDSLSVLRIPEEHSLIVRDVQLFSTSKTMPNILLIKNISFRVESRKIVTRSCSISTTHFMGFGVVHLILPAITRAFYAVYTAGIGVDVQERSSGNGVRYILVTVAVRCSCRWDWGARERGWRTGPVLSSG